MKRKVFVVLTLVLVMGMLLTLFAACGQKSDSQGAAKTDQSTEAKKDKIIVGVTVRTLQDPYFVEIVNGIKEAAKEEGVELMVDDPQEDVQKQLNSIETFMVSKVHGMIITAIDPESVNPIAKKAMDDGIKILAQNHELEHFDSWVTIIEYDYGFEGGKICGQWIKDNFPANEEVEVAIISYDKLKQGLERTKGLEEGILSIAPNAKIVAKQDAETTTAAMAVTEGILQANPNLKAIACFGDDTALGAYEAANSMLTEEQKKKFYVGGLDAVPQALDAIKSGGIFRGTVDIAPYETGKIALRSTLKLIKGEKVDKQILQPMVPVTEKNIGDYVK